MEKAPVNRRFFVGAGTGSAALHALCRLRRAQARGDLQLHGAFATAHIEFRGLAGLERGHGGQQLGHIADGFVAHLHDHIARSHAGRSEEHTSELQSPCNLVCRLLLEKKKNYTNKTNPFLCSDSKITVTMSHACSATSALSLTYLRSSFSCNRCLSYSHCSCVNPTTIH